MHRLPEAAAVLRGLVTMAAGHLASMALVAFAAVWGLPVGRGLVVLLSGGLLAALVIVHACARTPAAARSPVRHAGLAAGSFMLATVHGAGLALVPALMPLCTG